MRRISLQLILSVLFHLGWIPHQWGWPRVYIFLPLPFVKIAKLVLNRSLQSDAVGRVFLPENWTVLYRDQFWSPTFYENSESNHLMSHKSKDWTLTLYQRTQTLWSPYPSSEFQTHEIEDMWKEETTTYLKTKVFQGLKGIFEASSENKSISWLMNVRAERRAQQTLLSTASLLSTQVGFVLLHVFLSGGWLLSEHTGANSWLHSCCTS